MENCGASKCDIRIFQAGSFTLETQGFAFESRTCSSPPQTLHARTKKMDASKSRLGSVEAWCSTFRRFSSTLRCFSLTFHGTSFARAPTWCTTATDVVRVPKTSMRSPNLAMHNSKLAAGSRIRPARCACMSHPHSAYGTSRRFPTSERGVRRYRRAEQRGNLSPDPPSQRPRA